MDQFPRMFRLRQHFDTPRLQDIPQAVATALARVEVRAKVNPGDTVAIAVGSRGIRNLSAIVTAAVHELKRMGAEPFIVPAMGSHGGGTAEGQVKVLARLGVTPESAGCPVRSEIEPAVIGESPLGFPIYFDRVALTATHIVVINRIKPHTMFVGPVESGLMKMLLIGLAKPRGAALYHRAIFNYSFPQIIEGVVERVLAKCPVLCGLAIIENAAEDTAMIEGLRAEEFATHEPELLSLAKRLMPRLPFDEVDLLIIDQIGKDISGAGMDTNIVGRKYNDHEARPDERPRVSTIYVRGLTPATAGNATGIGIAEICRSRIIEQMDQNATRLNCLTAGHLTAAMLPVHFATDREALNAPFARYGLRPAQDWRWLWIRDTLHLGELLASEAYWQAAERSAHLDAVTEAAPLRFDDAGQLIEQFGVPEA